MFNTSPATGLLMTMAFFSSGQSALALAGRLLERTTANVQCRAASSALAVSASAPTPVQQNNGTVKSILPPRKPVKPRKRPSQLVRPSLQAPLVAEHVISRQIFASPPGRMGIGAVLGEDAAQALAARMAGGGAQDKGAQTAADGTVAKEAPRGSGSGSDSEGTIDVARTGPGHSSGSGSSSSGSSSAVGAGRGGAAGSSSESSSVGTVRFTSDSTGSAAAASSSEGVPSSEQEGAGSALVARPGQAGSDGEEGQSGGRTGRRRRVRLSDLPEGQRKQLEARRAALKSLSLAFPPGVTDSTVFAVVNHAGRQYKVTEGDIIQGERVKHAPVGSTLTLPVAILASRSKTVLGRPVVPGVHALVTVEEHARDVKDVVFKKKRRKRYQRTQGHRREVTRLRVTAISGDINTF